jgi:ribosomal protein S18 acetylase RimI-like enzyme
MVAIKQLEKSQISLLGQVDRSEYIDTHYLYKDGVLETEVVDWDVPGWADGDGEHSIGHLIESCEAVLAEDSVLLGAFDGNKVAGIAILRHNLTRNMAQLALLHVSRTYRRQGVAQKLTAEMERRAKAKGATEMYVSATPSGSAVGFYTSQGFKAAPPERIHPELYALEPEDIHMIKSL